MTLLRRQPRKAKRTGRLRCPGHLAFVRSFECAIPGCTRKPVSAAHIRGGRICGTAMKPDDTEVIPLCDFSPDAHHPEQHRIGEDAFAKKYGLDYDKIIAWLCKESDALRRYLARNRRAAA